jgi:hypothetical protein
VTPRGWSTCELPAHTAISDPLQGGGSTRQLTPGPRAGLEPATLLVNAGTGCSAVAKPREAVILKLVTCWYMRRIEDAQLTPWRRVAARGVCHENTELCL